MPLPLYIERHSESGSAASIAPVSLLQSDAAAFVRTHSLTLRRRKKDPTGPLSVFTVLLRAALGREREKERERVRAIYISGTLHNEWELDGARRMVHDTHK